MAKCPAKGCFMAEGHAGGCRSYGDVFSGSLEPLIREMRGSSLISPRLSKAQEEEMENVNTEKAGGSRFSGGKPGGWWYAPLFGLRAVARVWEYGASKYAPLDWKEGQSFSTLLDCAMRHTLEVMDKGPWAIDRESGCFHAAHVAWNWLALLTFMVQQRTDLDDTAEWRGVTAATKEKTPASNCEPPTRYEPNYREIV